MKAMCIVAIYGEKEKSVMTVPGMTLEETKELYDMVAKAIENDKKVIILDLQSRKGDLLLIMVDKLVAIYATPVDGKDN